MLSAQNKHWEIERCEENGGKWEEFWEHWVDSQQNFGLVENPLICSTHSRSVPWQFMGSTDWAWSKSPDFPFLRSARAIEKVCPPDVPMRGFLGLQEKETPQNPNACGNLSTALRRHASAMH